MGRYGDQIWGRKARTDRLGIASRCLTTAILTAVLGARRRAARLRDDQTSLRAGVCTKLARLGDQGRSDADVVGADEPTGAEVVCTPFLPHDRRDHGHEVLRGDVAVSRGDTIGSLVHSQNRIRSVAALAHDLCCQPIVSCRQALRLIFACVDDGAEAMWTLTVRMMRPAGDRSGL